MNSLKLHRCLFNSKFLYSHARNPVFLLRANSSASTPAGSEQSEASVVKKSYPHGIDLRSLKGNSKDDRKKYRRDDFNYAAAFLMGTLPCIAFSLGMWQIDRRKWKLEKIAMLESRTSAKPIEIPKDLSLLKTPDYEYMPIKLRGHFDHAREVLLTMRPDTTGTNSKPGGYLITPFVLSDRNLTILVNRGHLPYTKYLVETRKGAQIQGDIELVGLNRHSEVVGNFQVPNKPHMNEWHHRDIDVMAVCLDTAPVFIDALYDSTIRNSMNEPVGPVGGQTIINLKNDHLTYMITWFTLSAFTAIMWFKGFGLPLLKRLKR